MQTSESLNFYGEFFLMVEILRFFKIQKLFQLLRFASLKESCHKNPRQVKLGRITLFARNLISTEKRNFSYSLPQQHPHSS